MEKAKAQLDLETGVRLTDLRGLPTDQHDAVYGHGKQIRRFGVFGVH